MRAGIGNRNNGLICRVLVHGEDGSYIIQDTSYQTKQFRKDELKQAIKQGQLNVIDLQISKDGRLVKKTVDLKSVCIPYHGLNGDWSLPLLAAEQQEKILFYGLAFINSNMTTVRKQNICKKIHDTGGMDADDLISLFTKNESWTNEHYWRLDTACKDKVIDLMYKLAK